MSGLQIRWTLLAQVKLRISDTIFTMKMILVVDDEIDILETIIDTLDIEFDDKITVDRAMNGVEALKLFREKKYDLVITDLNMPEMNGIDFSMEVKGLNEMMPIIVFTGHGDVEELSRLNNVGVQAMIKKPYVEKLMEAVSQYV